MNRGIVDAPNRISPVPSPTRTWRWRSPWSGRACWWPADCCAGRIGPSRRGERPPVAGDRPARRGLRDPVVAVAALAALSDEGEAEVAGHLEGYRQNRAALMAALPELGFTDIAPADGAFYAYAGISRLSNDSREFCAHLLAEGGVAATPGLDFDPVRGQSTMRFSFAQSPAKIAEGIARLRRYIQGR